MNIINQVIPTREEIIDLAGMLEIPRTESYFDRMEEANDLLQAAYEPESPAKGVALARKAFELDPFLSDALLHIAKEGKLSFPETLMYLNEALRISISLLSKEDFSTKDYPFWLDYETRPFMRALHCLGITYYEERLFDYAEFYLSFALDLNPNDNQGIRYLHAHVLLSQRKIKEAKKFLDKWNESSAQLAYARLLLGLIEQRASDQLEKLWEEAYESNSYIPELLLKRSIPYSDGYYQRGDENEACVYLGYGWRCWHNNLAELSWLRRKCGAIKRRNTLSLA